MDVVYFSSNCGLGRSSTAILYAIKDKEEAEIYISHEILGQRLIEISEVLLKLDEEDAKAIFEFTDARKLKSSMTLFSLVSESEDNIFKNVLYKFFDGKIDYRTKEYLGM